MISAARLLGGALLLTLPVQAPSAPQAAAVYAVARIGSGISDDEIVGQKRAGLMCLPNGSIRWSDVTVGTSMDQREIVQDVLEDEGVAVTPLGEFVASNSAGRVLRLRGSVRSASFSLCARHWGTGDARALSGDTRLEIEWRAESRDDAAVEQRHVSTVTRRADGAHAAPLGAIYRALLKDAARDLAQWLIAPPQP